MAAVPPTGTALDWINAGSSLLSSVGSLNGKPAAPGVATSGGPQGNNADVDFSGFTVATGQARADGARINKTSADALGGAMPSTLSAGASAALSGNSVWIAAGVVGVALAWRLLKK